MATSTKIKTEHYSVKERIKPSLTRLLWYLITFGKCGERYHYQHVLMKRYITVPLEINISAKTLRFTESLQSMKVYNCRCSVKVATGVLVNEQANKKD